MESDCVSNVVQEVDVVVTKKRALILADFIFPEYLGGSARFASELNDSLVESGFDVTCITRRPIGHYSSSFKVSRSYKIIYVDNFRSVLSQLVLYKWDLVISHHFALGIFSYLARSKNGFVFYFFHGPVHLERLSRGGNLLSATLRRGIECFVMRQQKNIFCLSDFMKSHLSSRLKKKAIITGPLHSYKTSDLPPCKTYSLGPINLLTVRRLTNRTGVLELAELVSKLDKAVTLTVVGGGELLGVLRDLKYSNLKVIGQVEDDELDRLYRQSDLVVLPSLELEGFGLIIIEAILRGTPVLASDKAGGGAEFLSKFSTDFIYNLSCGEERFLDSARRAIDAFKDEDIRGRLIESIREFDMKSFIGRYLMEEIQ